LPISIFERKIFGQIETIIRAISKINFKNNDNVPIVVITANEDGTIKTKAVATGAVAFLQKIFQ
jgi:CheY-like chemotaxis protein